LTTRIFGATFCPAHWAVKTSTDSASSHTVSFYMLMSLFVFVCVSIRTCIHSRFLSHTHTYTHTNANRGWQSIRRPSGRFPHVRCHFTRRCATVDASNGARQQPSVSAHARMLVCIRVCLFCQLIAHKKYTHQHTLHTPTHTHARTPGLRRLTRSRAATSRLSVASSCHSRTIHTSTHNTHSNIYTCTHIYAHTLGLRRLTRSRAATNIWSVASSCHDLASSAPTPSSVSVASVLGNCCIVLLMSFRDVCTCALISNIHSVFSNIHSDEFVFVTTRALSNIHYVSRFRL
jgi:hypothetical protein